MSAPLSVSIASGTELCVKYGHHVILDNAKLSITEGERIGLVGRNGAGKSTALKIIAGVEEPDSGIVSIRRDVIVGYLPQDFDLDGEQTVLQNVLAGAAQVQALIDTYEANPSSDDASTLLDRITALDGWNVESRAQSLINNLHAPEASRLVRDLSGGEKRRVALCRTLVAQRKQGGVLNVTGHAIGGVGCQIDQAVNGVLRANDPADPAARHRMAFRHRPDHQRALGHAGQCAGANVRSDALCARIS